MRLELFQGIGHDDSVEPLDIQYTFSAVSTADVSLVGSPTSIGILSSDINGELDGAVALLRKNAITLLIMVFYLRILVMIFFKGYS